MLSTVAWSDHKPFLLSGIRKLFQTGDMSDLTVKCRTKEFRVHRLILGLFTDFFKDQDGLWVRINVDENHFENALKFMYHGQVTVASHDMEGFLATCRFLKITLFKPADLNMEGMTEAQYQEIFHQERYELNDFQLLCRKCYKCYANEKDLKRHTWGCLKPRDFACRFCERTFRFRKEWEEHEQTHDPDYLVRCTVDGCDRVFKCSQTLRRHIHVNHLKKRYQCSECPDKNYTTLHMLKHHQIEHHGRETPHVCSVCNRGFVSKCNLDYHRRDGCGKRREHKFKMEKVKGENPDGVVRRESGVFNELFPDWDGRSRLVCPKEGCGVSYEKRSSMLRHIQVKHEKKRYFCQICDEKSYTSSTMLKWHMAQEHGSEKAYSCEACGERFAIKSRLNTHFKKYHTEEGWLKTKEYERKHYLKRKAAGAYVKYAEAKKARNAERRAKRIGDSVKMEADREEEIEMEQENDENQPVLIDEEVVA